MQDQAQGMTMKIKTGKANPDHSPTTKDIAAQDIAINIEATLDHNTRIDAAITKAAHNDLNQPTEDTARDLAMTHCTNHITDHPHTTALWVIGPEIAVGHTHYHPTNLQCMNDADQIHTAAG